MKLRKTVVAAVLVAVLAVAAVAAAAAFSPTTQARASDPVVLTVTGNGGQQKTFTMTQLKALTNYAGWFGFVNSAGTVYAPQSVVGVRLTDVLAEVGGMQTVNACDITAVDNYGMTYTYGQIVSRTGVQMYDVVKDGDKDKAVAADSKAPWDFVLAWEQNGSPLPSDVGPVRLVVAQETNVNQVVDGHYAVKWVDRVTLRGAVAEWKVKMYGLRQKNGKRQTYTLDRGSYDSCATPGCHGFSWVNPTTKKTWSGVPLFLCIGKVDGGPGHDSYGAYNEALALKGYRIKLVSTTGKTAIVGSRAVRNRTTIILANKLMGADLTSAYYPLKLVGPTKRVASRSQIGRISKIYLLPK
jgi:DMSO/TMAO reductase YedYZ molybdopterin-dependent catalytic subunit